MPNPAVKFQAKTDYFTPDSIKERVPHLTEFFVLGPYDYDMRISLLGVWNDQFTDGSCKHPLWIAKPQAAADAPALKQELAKRIASRLAKWRWLNYSEASDETDLGFLNLSLAAAGYLPRNTVDEALLLFSESALGPICHLDDIRGLEVGKERRLNSPRINYTFDKCDVCNFRVSPHLDHLVFLEQERTKTARESFDSLSPADKARILADLMPVHQAVEAPVPISPAPAGDVVSMVSAVVEALDIPNIVKKCSKRSQDSDADSEEEGADRFDRLTSFGSQELRKEARAKTLSEMKLQSELTRLRNTQNDRKVKAKCELSLQFSMALDKETEFLVNSAEIEDEKDKSLCVDQLTTLKEVDLFTANRLRGLQEELECIASCLLLKSEGNNDLASMKMKIFVHDKAGHKESKYMRDLDKRAAKKLKADNETKMMQGFATISKGFAANPNLRNQGNQRANQTPRIQPPGAAPVPPTHPYGKGGGKGKGKTGGKGNGGVRNFVLQFIDGAYFDPSLAGVQAPAPSAFPSFHPYILDSPSGGIVHGPNSNWHGTCGNPNCNAVGHGHTECKAARWSTNGVDHVIRGRMQRKWF